ncbi:MAG: hypothetical protein RLZZ591_417 [Pseudomonadota bacterium]|jgi:molybdopterin synthase sulfur carrier subunit
MSQARQITIRYFASIREAVGLGQEQLTTSAVTVGEVREALIARGGAFADSLARHRAVRVALNQVMASETDALPDGAELAFFPPVTGG